MYTQLHKLSFISMCYTLYCIVDNTVWPLVEHGQHSLTIKTAITLFKAFPLIRQYQYWSGSTDQETKRLVGSHPTLKHIFTENWVWNWLDLNVHKRFPRDFCLTLREASAFTFSKRSVKSHFLILEGVVFHSCFPHYV